MVQRLRSANLAWLFVLYTSPHFGRLRATAQNEEIGKSKIWHPAYFRVLPAGLDWFFGLCTSLCFVQLQATAQNGEI
jgi:hypothetical protein